MTIHITVWMVTFSEHGQNNQTSSTLIVQRELTIFIILVKLYTFPLNCVVVDFQNSFLGKHSFILFHVTWRIVHICVYLQTLSITSCLSYIIRTQHHKWHNVCRSRENMIALSFWACGSCSKAAKNQACFWRISNRDWFTLQ